MMAPNQDIILAFDLYGTLLSTTSISSALSAYCGEEKAQKIASLWRTYQLEYSWRLNSMHQYEPFSTVTVRSLCHALAESNVSLKQNEIDIVIQSYDSLNMFPDVGPALDALSKTSGITSVVFSNGTYSMVSNSVKNSADLSRYGSLFRDLIVVDDAEPADGKVKKYKPAPEVYYHLAKRLGKGTSREEMGSLWLISGNPFDVVGARGVGMKAVWVSRSGIDWQDALIGTDAGRPTLVVKELGELIDKVRGYAR